MDDNKKYKDVKIKIVGKHIHDNNEEDAMELITEAKMYSRDDVIYILYEESALSGMEGVKTRMRVDKDSLKLSRKGGEIGSRTTEMYFKKGKRFENIYATPMGMVEVEMLTKDFHNTMNFDGTGEIKIDYDISLKGLSEGSSRLEVNFL